MQAATWGQWPVVSAAASTFPTVAPVTSSSVSSVSASQAAVQQYQMSLAYYGSQGSSWPSITQQQQWQQWEQWQQQYAQWHQQYGEKYAHSLGLLSGMSALGGVPPPGQGPPLPSTGIPAQPPPPASLENQPSGTSAASNDDSTKPDTSAKRPLEQPETRDDAKKSKVAKSKPETLQELIEAEKVFDEQFKKWEEQFLKWKEQNSNHPDKTQYREYEQKWENWREQFNQKRELMKKKREAKEAELAQIAAKEAEAVAAATAAAAKTNTKTFNSMIPQDQQLYHSQYGNQHNSLLEPNPNNMGAGYMQNYSMYNMANSASVPSGVPPVGQPFINHSPFMHSTPPLGHSIQPLPQPPPFSGCAPEKIRNESDEFLKGNNVKGIPGLDFIGNRDRDASASINANMIPPSLSMLSSVTQDFNKPFLRSSDGDKPFNFPSMKPDELPSVNAGAVSNPDFRPHLQSYPYGNRQQPEVPYPTPQGYGMKNTQDAVKAPDYLNRNNPYSNRDFDSNKYRGPYNSVGPSVNSNDTRFDYRTLQKNSPVKADPKLNKFNDEKYAKYLEDEYDDSRFRDPEEDHRNDYRQGDQLHMTRNKNIDYNNRFDSRSGSMYNKESFEYNKMHPDKFRPSNYLPVSARYDDKSENKFPSSVGTFNQQRNDRGPVFNERNFDTKPPLLNQRNSDTIISYNHRPPNFVGPVTQRNESTLNNKRIGDIQGGLGQFGQNNTTHELLQTKKPLLPEPQFQLKFFGGPQPLRGDLLPSALPVNDRGPISKPPEFPPQLNAALSKKESSVLREPPRLQEPAKVQESPNLLDVPNVQASSQLQESRKPMPLMPLMPLMPPMPSIPTKPQEPGKLMSLMDITIQRPPILDGEKSNPDFASQNSKPGIIQPIIPGGNRPSADEILKQDMGPPTVPTGNHPQIVQSNMPKNVGNLIPPIITPGQQTGGPLLKNPEIFTGVKAPGSNLHKSMADVGEFIPNRVFDYTHLKGKSVSGILEIDYTFDYKHGIGYKPPHLAATPIKKTPDHQPPVSKKVSDPSSTLTKKLPDQPWEGESWENVDKSNVNKVTPLPPRNRKGSTFGNDKYKMDREKESAKQKNQEVGKDESKLNVSTARKTVLIEDLLSLPGRNNRPHKICIIFRGPPGSGKTYAAKLIKDKEVEMGGSAPRILSLDDYFQVEVDKMEVDEKTGKSVTQKNMEYVYEEKMVPRYEESLIKTFKRTVSDGFFPFIIVDCINDRLNKYEEMYLFAKSSGFQVYVVEMDMEATVCAKRNVHKRTETEISAIIEKWEKTPLDQDIVDIRSLLQSAAITEIEMEDVDNEEKEQNKNRNENARKENDDKENEDKKSDGENEDNLPNISTFLKCKWDAVNNTEDRLDRLDGIKKKKTSTTITEWLEEEGKNSDLTWYKSTKRDAGKKTVRWADLEEIMAQEKMKAIGFVVGQTDWKRMMDPSSGENKLNRTKYI